MMFLPGIMCRDACILYQDLLIPSTGQGNAEIDATLRAGDLATVAQSDKEAKRRIREFLEHKTAKVKPKS